MGIHHYMKDPVPLLRNTLEIMHITVLTDVMLFMLVDRLPDPLLRNAPLLEHVLRMAG